VTTRLLPVGCLLLAAAANSADKPAYRLFDTAGKAADYATLLSAAAGADVVFFGEQHDHAVVHWLQRELAVDLYKAGRPLALGYEMLEADDQIGLDELSAGLIRDEDFAQEAKLWPTWARDYQPLFTFGTAHKLHLLATNIPRRYAALVAREGLPALDRLSDEAKRLIAPLPLEVDLTLPGYKAMLDMAGATPTHSQGKPEWLAQAQAIKDATMAWRIATGLREGERLLHLNGTYHTQRREGIVWYLKRLKPDWKVLVIASESQEELGRLDEESRGLGDFVLVTAEGLASGS
jgi:uncharacterized iron-regulated protein